jgi:hypothetical protein
LLRNEVVASRELEQRRQFRRWISSPRAQKKGRSTMSENTKVGKMGEWQHLLTAINANQDDLTELETNRARLETVLAQAQQIVQRQESYAASKQEATQLLKGVMSECQRLGTLLRLGLKQHYGPRSEKLTEFGVQPFRGRTRKGTDEGLQRPEAPAPAKGEIPAGSAD